MNAEQLQNKMKRLLLAILCLALAGCDFTVSLSDTPEMAIDARATGLWVTTKPHGNTEHLLVLPFNEREYIIIWPKGGTTELYARAHLFDFHGKTLVQLEWFGNSDGVVPDDNRIYQYASYAVTGDELEIQMLNTDVVGKDFQSSAELARVIAANMDNPALFRDKTTYKKVQK